MRMAQSNLPSTGSRCESFLTVKSMKYEHVMNWSEKNDMFISMWFYRRLPHFYHLRCMVTSHSFKGGRTSRRRLRSGEAMRVAFSIGRITWEKDHNLRVDVLDWWKRWKHQQLGVVFSFPECPSILADVFVFSLPQWWVRWEQDD